jgi:hypothetical protein
MSTTYTVVDVDNDGNCFFNALYFAAMYADCLEKVTSAFQIGDSMSCIPPDHGQSEHGSQLKYFISCARQAILPFIQSQLEGMYTVLNDLKTKGTTLD